ncbi:50S ribosomal protein L32 [Heliophilum fasciatum]|uniref:Large ribosomal subunit protein bL32 n=1 Tax=Heliophilum fasciatum TaxID=35700 RepID=A0A4R2RM10_9FIRM|nr:50S ribosomal protein L32 [Heliophilum fasciatum]MCW2278412.1 large subunit ribosomal protein L32 [Heliophilum fasciatum]TCP63689.1 large subunit ribosomal protein L32 [Heliophilum fasciatum]
MGVPQHRRSKSRNRQRRAQQKLEMVSFASCPKCQEPKMPHRVCSSCGYYRDREVVKQD